MLGIIDYEAFFREIAEKCTPLSHSEQNPSFALMEIDDIISGTKGKLDFRHPIMILENPEGGFSPRADEFIDEVRCAFMILTNVPRNDAHKKKLALESTKVIATQIIIYIHEIKRKFLNAEIPFSIAVYFRPDSVQYQKVGPIFSDAYGWRFELSLGKPFVATLNPLFWNES